MIDSIFNSGKLFQTLCLAGLVTTVVLPITWAAFRVIKHWSAAKRLAIWNGVFAGLILLPVAILVFPKFNLGFSIGHGKETAAPIHTRSLETQSVASAPFPGPSSFQLNSESNTRVEPTTQSPVTLPHHAKNTNQVTRPNELSVVESKPSAASPPAGMTTLSWQRVVCYIWLAGFLWLCLRLFRSHAAASRILKQSQPLPSNTPLQAFDPRRHEIRLSHEVASPVTVGLLHPKVLLPAEAADWTRAQTRMVLAHELTHVDRRDVAWQLIASVTRSMYWFHPLVWLAFAKMKLEREFACDDQVISNGELPSEYSNMLLQMATALAHHSTSPGQNELLGVSMAQKPIQRRLANILSASKKRSVASPGFKALSLLLVSALMLVLGVVRPFGTPVEAAAMTDETSTISAPERFSLPNELTGQVLDSQGQPIVGALVALKLTPTFSSNPPLASMKDLTVHFKTVTTDESGRYKVPTQGIEIVRKKCHIDGFIKADGYPHYQPNFFIKDIEKTLQLPVIKMKPGRLISGRVVAPADASASPVDAVIRLTGDAKLQRNSFRWESATIACDTEGMFEAYVPTVGRVELSATAENYAGVQMPVAQDLDQLEVQLAKGTSVFGRVLNETGQPVAGAIVTVSGVLENELSRIGNNPMFSPITHSVPTDAQGRYRLPPFSGRARIFLASSGRSRTDDHYVFTDQMPVIAPQVIELTGVVPESEINLNVQSNAKLTGTIRWQDGSPAENVLVRAYIMCGGSSVDVSKTQTDASGYYTVEVPANAQENTVGMMVIGAIDATGQSKIAYPKTEVDLSTKQQQSIGFKSVTTDLGGLDWEMRDRERPATSATVDRHRRTDADLVLEELDTRRKDQGASFTSEDYCNELLKLEAKYRGEFASVLAMREVLLRTHDDWPDPFQNKLYRQIMDRLAVHYIDHKDVDICAQTVTGQLHNPKAVAFLKRLQTESSHEHVRASAYFDEFIHLAEQLRNYRMLKQADWKFDLAFPETVNEQELLRLKEQQTATIERIKSLDPQSLQARLETLSKKLNDSYPTVMRTTLLGHIGSAVFDRYQSPDARTYAAMASDQLNVLNTMKVGATQRIEAIAPDGQPFDLRDLKGNVVLVFFSSNWHSDRQRQFYQTFRDMKAKYKNSPVPLEIVTVLVDSDVKYAKEPVEDGSITWPAVWDEHQKLMSSWDVRALTSDMYLLDHEGVLQGRFFDESDKQLESKIKQLIGRASAKR